MRKLLFITCCLITLFATDAFAQRGCCSWHSGVSGCTYDGRVRCNDGSISPSCTCR